MADNVTNTDTEIKEEKLTLESDSNNPGKKPDAAPFNVFKIPNQPVRSVQKSNAPRPDSPTVWQRINVVSYPFRTNVGRGTLPHPLGGVGRGTSIYKARKSVQTPGQHETVVTVGQAEKRTHSTGPTPAEIQSRTSEWVEEQNNALSSSSSERPGFRQIIESEKNVTVTSLPPSKVLKTAKKRQRKSRSGSKKSRKSSTSGSKSRKSSTSGTKSRKSTTSGSKSGSSRSPSQSKRNEDGTVQRLTLADFNIQSGDTSEDFEIESSELSPALTRALYLKSLAQDNSGGGASSSNAKVTEVASATGETPTPSKTTANPTPHIDTHQNSDISTNPGNSDKSVDPKKQASITAGTEKTIALGTDLCRAQITSSQPFGPPAVGIRNLPEIYPLLNESLSPNVTYSLAGEYGMKILRQITPALTAAPGLTVKGHKSCKVKNCRFHETARGEMDQAQNAFCESDAACQDDREMTAHAQFVNPPIILAKTHGNDENLTKRSKKVNAKTMRKTVEPYIARTHKHLKQTLHRELGIPGVTKNHFCSHCNLHGEANAPKSWQARVVSHSETALGQTRNRELVVGDVCAVKETFKKFQDEIIMHDDAPNGRKSHMHACLPNRETCLENGEQCTTTVFQQAFMTEYPSTDGTAINMRCHGVCQESMREHKLALGYPVLICAECNFGSRVRVPRANLQHTKLIVEKFDVNVAVEQEKLHTYQSCIDTSGPNPKPSKV